MSAKENIKLAVPDGGASSGGLLRPSSHAHDTSDGTAINILMIPAYILGALSLSCLNVEDGVIAMGLLIQWIDGTTQILDWYAMGKLDIIIQITKGLF